MKKGDKVPVNIAGDVVAQATVEKVDVEANTVTMVFPATRVVMGLRTEIDTAPAEPEPQPEPSKQTIITGVDRVDAEGNVISPNGEVLAPPAEPEPASESAPVVESSEIDTNGAVETPVGESTQTEVTAPEPVTNE